MIFGIKKVLENSCHSKKLSSKLKLKFRVCLVTNLSNAIKNNEKISFEWESSYIINLYKGKGDALERGNYRGIKLLDHVMKVIEREIEKILRALLLCFNSAAFHHCA